MKSLWMLVLVFVAFGVFIHIAFVHTLAKDNGWSSNAAIIFTAIASLLFTGFAASCERQV